MKRPSAMKNVEEEKNVRARFASFFMAVQPPLHVRAANASLKRRGVYGAVCDGDCGSCL